MERNSTIGEILAEFVVDTRYRDLPKDVIELEKTVTLGVLGTAIAGSGADGSETVADLSKEWGGKKEATILVHGGKVPAYNAAMVNAYMARALDFDDVFGVGGTGMHMGAEAVPAALATAELLGGCNGQDFLNALALGTEIAVRIGSASSCTDGWDGTGMLGIFGNTAIAGKLLGLNQKQMVDALGLAFSKAAGSNMANGEGSLGTRMLEGFASQSGIVCAQLAQRGITGPRSFLEHKLGYYALYAEGGEYDREVAVSGLGKEYLLHRVRFKPYPACTLTQATTQGMMSLVKEQALTPENIDHIEITIAPKQYPLVGRPFEAGFNPVVWASFSVQYCAASVLLRKDCRLDYFDSAHASDPRITEIVKKIHVSTDQSVAEGKNPTILDVTTKSGKKHHMVKVPELSLTKEGHHDKFRDCFNHASKPLPKKNAELVIDMCERLEKEEDVTKLLPLLVSRAK